MTEEIWKPVVGYEGLYEVSSYGRVRSLDRYVRCDYEKYRLHKGKVLSPGKDKDGYLSVVLSCNGKHKKITIHRLVAQAFIPNPNNLPIINHIDENPSNDNVDNLEWCTAKYNSNYGTRNDRIRDTAIKNRSWTGLSKEEYQKKWYQENKEKKKRYYLENKDKIRDYKKKYYWENNDKINEYQREYRRKKKAGL